MVAHPPRSRFNQLAISISGQAVRHGEGQHRDQTTATGQRSAAQSTRPAAHARQPAAPRSSRRETPKETGGHRWSHTPRGICHTWSHCTILRKSNHIDRRATAIALNQEHYSSSGLGGQRGHLDGVEKLLQGFELDYQIPLPHHIIEVPQEPAELTWGFVPARRFAGFQKRARRACSPRRSAGLHPPRSTSLLDFSNTPTLACRSAGKRRASRSSATKMI